MKGFASKKKEHRNFFSYLIHALAMLSMIYGSIGSVHAEEGIRKETNRRPRVSVLVFRNKTSAPDQDHWGYVLTYAVREDLSAVPRVIVVDLAQLSRVLGDKKWEPTGPNEPDKIQEIVTFTHADLLVTGSLKRNQDEWTVEVNLHSASPYIDQDQGRPRIEPAEQSEGDATISATFKLSGTDLLDIGDQIVLRLLNELSVVPNTQETAKIRSKPTSNIAAYEEVAKSIMALEQARVHQAVGYCKKAIELDPSFVFAHVALGNAYSVLGEGDLAIASFKEAIRLDPTHLCRANMAVVLRKMGRVDDAIREYSEVIKHHPDYPYIQVQLAVAYNYKREYQQAIDVLKEALHLDPYVPDGHYLLGMIYRQQGQLEQAIAEFRQAIRDYPADIQAFVMLAVVYEERNEIDEAIKTLQEGLKANPRYGKAHNNLAVLYIKKGMYNLAWKHVHEAQRLGFEVHPDILRELRANSKEPER